ncbi:isoprenylcysteine carboxylmethyltransferase family protein [Bacteriovorax stolpii]|uniref:methyltransferase family protein n=1 Tax=Bacteriovorax stolpii TaxID=960 RepID=UPI001159D601|nr:isoprenylcysteine carboxylmethyltransferase family protein [Bacteriovorax stolpii]QDK43634.1 isoprenylcysteine carboxylmethyltransferase family protein [Bacteriovorax stolpii]
MNHSSTSAYGLWSLVIINSLIFIFFAFSFFKPQTKSDWRTFGSFSAFIVALFAEMYGFPLTIYLLSGWLTKKFPLVDFFTHDSGHLLHTLLGFKGNPHFDVLHILSNILIVAGFWLLSSSWRILYKAEQAKTLAISGPYHYVRHPQYVAFILVMFGFLLQWPTFVTLIMFPILVWTYVRLAKREEKVVEQIFGNTYIKYAKDTPRFFPKDMSFINRKEGHSRA